MLVDDMMSDCDITIHRFRCGQVGCAEFFHKKTIMKDYVGFAALNSLEFFANEAFRSLLKVKT